SDATLLLTRQAARLQATLAEADITAHVQSDLIAPPAPASTLLVQGITPEGFVLRGLEKPPQGNTNGGDYDLHFLSDTELFGWSKPQARHRPTAHSTVAPEIFFADVKPGDYVVHLEHGVGVYDGLVKIELGGMTREYL